MKGSAVVRRPALEPVERCKCGAWNIRGRYCPTCADLAEHAMRHVYAATAALWLLAFVVFLSL